jgi:hypothetical protein
MFRIEDIMQTFGRGYDNVEEKMKVHSSEDMDTWSNTITLDENIFMSRQAKNMDLWTPTHSQLCCQHVRWILNCWNISPIISLYTV